MTVISDRAGRPTGQMSRAACERTPNCQELAEHPVATIQEVAECARSKVGNDAPGADAYQLG